MSKLKINEMLDVGAHLGHQTRRWNPKMAKYIFGVRNGIHIIDLRQTVDLFDNAYDFILKTVSAGGKVLFVGTKKQASEIIPRELSGIPQYYVNVRWLGGMLTNFKTIKQSVERLKKLEQMSDDGTLEKLSKKESVRLIRELNKLKKNLTGIREMNKLPQAVFIVDPKRERIAVDEALRLGIPIVSMVDTNCDPDVIDFPIPANDDSIRSVGFWVKNIAEACVKGEEIYNKSIEKKRKEKEKGKSEKLDKNISIEAAGKSTKSEKFERSAKESEDLKTSKKNYPKVEVVQVSARTSMKIKKSESNDKE